MLTASLAYAGVLKQHISFKASQFDFSSKDNYSVVLGQDMDVTDQPGTPQLPVKPVSFVLPGNCRVTDVRIEAQNWKTLEHDISVFPCQKQQVLCFTDNNIRFTEPDQRIYQSTKPYPENPSIWAGTGHRAGNTVVDLLFYPVRFIGAEKMLQYCRGFDVEVEYECRKRGQGFKGSRVQGTEPWNPGSFEYLIVTSTSYDSIFQRLADWKTQKGVPAAIRHIDWVYSNYPGRDNPEKLRNYLKTLPDSGVKYVLLGGDVSVMPYRKAFAMRSEANIHDREDSLPCDLYFSDLDGTWDFNDNNVFGEIGDSVDLYPDIFVGRAPVDSRTEAQNFVNKVLEYEKNPAYGYQNKVLFFAMVLWSDPYTDGGKHKDMLEAKSFPSGYNVTKLYERLGNETRSSVMAAIRDGQNFLNHDGHGWYNQMSCGRSGLRTRDADTITNAYRGILYSIGCWTTAFDFTSIGEAFVTNGHGGTVALIGNSSYGWGSPGNPGFGYSDKFDDRFWWMIQNEGFDRIGEALAHSKEYYVPFSRGKNVYRWHQYQVNLMGDPEMPVWTALPETLTITGPAAIPMGTGHFLITVAHQGAPVPGALVCLMKGNESYAHGYTDEAGKVWLATTPQTAGNFTLTATAHNYYPAQKTIPCVSGSYVNFAGWTINDSLGNNDGVVNPGETVFLPTWLHNAGTQASSPVNLVLRFTGPGVDIVDSTAQAPGLNPDDSVYIPNAFQIDVWPCPEDGQIFQFDLEVSDAFEQHTFHPVALVGKPVLKLERYFLREPPALPGTTKKLKIAIDNQGHGFSHGTWAKLFSLDPHVSVLEPESILVGEIDPLELMVAADSFNVSISVSCPGSYLAPIKLETNCENYSFCDTFKLLIGQSGFSDDMESGPAKWTHGGSGDRWNLSTYRSHSSNHAWYCGDDGTHRYSNYMNTYLTTTPFMVAENCSLKFWRWFSVPNYGVDGIYVIILHDGGNADTLDFIGTGGALGNPKFGIECDWYQEKYDLSYLQAGDTIQVKIPFKSDDEDVGEGFYIDDVEVTGGGQPVTFIKGAEPRTRKAMRFLSWPNPFMRKISIRLAGCPENMVSGRIYDATGRVARNFSVNARNGQANWLWNGADNKGRRLPPGAYFVEVRSGNETRLGKLLLMR